MIENIIAFLGAIPRIISLIEKLGAYIKEKEVDKWFENIEKAIDDVEKAKTPDEKHTAARDLARAIRGTPR